MLCEINTFLDKYAAIFSFLTTTLWAIYVFFTIKSFTQIKKQTELQSEAFLVVTSSILFESKVARQREYAYYHPRFISEITSTTSAKDEAIFKKWHGIIKTNVPEALGQEQFLILELSNRGRSDIIYWKITVQAEISPGAYLANKFNIIGEEYTWEIEYSGSKDIVTAGSSIPVPAARVGVYPNINISWKIEYEDMRGRKYAAFAGDRSESDSNSLADPLQELFPEK